MNFCYKMELSYISVTLVGGAASIMQHLLEQWGKLQLTLLHTHDQCILKQLVFDEA